MLEVLDADAMRAADAHAIAHEPIASLDLMERAASAFTGELLRSPLVQGAGTSFLIACGPGNNGGDGLVSARSLHQKGYPVRVVALEVERTSQDFTANLKRLRDAGILPQVFDPDAGLDASGCDVLIDAGFGTGLTRPLEGRAASFAEAMNATGLPIVSVDLPSGMPAGGATPERGQVLVRARLTLTFQCPKPALLQREWDPWTGRWKVVPIGLDESFIRSLGARQHLLELPDIRQLLPERGAFDHKGDHGHALLLAGARGRVGAAVLATRACLRSGAGLVTSAVPGHALPILQATAPEAMCLPDGSPDHLTHLPGLGPFTAMGMGPGAGTHEDTGRLLKLLIQEAAVPLVLDADALNLLAENPTWLGFLPKDTILTPHPGEFDRLAGRSDSGQERLDKAREFAVRHGVVLVLKGAWTATCTPDGHAFHNATGNPGMAKGGSGDVLTGLLTGLRAQGLSAAAAAMLGVWLHGLAGDMAARDHGMDAMQAGDLIEALPGAWQVLREALP